MGESWGERCRRIVEGVVRKREWKLVTDLADFAKKVCAEVRKLRINEAEKERQAIERATVRRYCVILYGACSEAGSSRQDAAFKDLWRYFYSIARHKTGEPDLAQELAQRALVKTFEKLGQCREPKSFLKFAWLILLNVVRDHYRELKKHGGISVPFEDSSPNSKDEKKRADEIMKTSGLESDERAPDEEAINHVSREQFHRDLLAIIRSCVKHELQQTVLIELLIKGKELQEVAEDLNLKVTYVRVLKHNGLVALRDCDAFIRFFEDWLS